MDYVWIIVQGMQQADLLQQHIEVCRGGITEVVADTVTFTQAAADTVTGTQAAAQNDTFT